MRTIICLFAILATCFAHASNKYYKNRVRALQLEFSDLAAESSWATYLEKRRSVLASEDYQYLRKLNIQKNAVISNVRSGVQIKFGGKTFKVLIDDKPGKFLVNGETVAFDITQSLQKLVKHKLMKSNKRLRKPAKDKFSILKNIFSSVAWADSEISEEMFAYITGPMIISAQKNEGKSNPYGKGFLSNVECSKKPSGIVLNYDRGDREIQRFTVPDEFKGTDLENRGEIHYNDEYPISVMRYDHNGKEKYEQGERTSPMGLFRAYDEEKKTVMLHLTPDYDQQLPQKDVFALPMTLAQFKKLRSFCKSSGGKKKISELNERLKIIDEHRESKTVENTQAPTVGHESAS